jgi:hypothetical protein
MSWLYDSDDSNPDALFDSDPDDDDAISEPHPDDDMPQVWLALHHYAFRKGRSKPINKDHKKLLYQCDRAGPVPVANRQQDDP